VKKVLLSMMVLGCLSFFTISGAFALVSSESQNNRGTIASGTLTFSNKVNALSACFSYGAGSSANVNASCSPLYSNATLMYPGTAATAQVTITNDGSLDGSTLSVFMPSCSVVTSPAATSPGGGNPCTSSDTQFYIQETNSSFTPTSCVYPTAGGACAFAANSFSYFTTTANTAGAAYSLGAGPAHATSRYFIVGMQLSASASNTLQAEEALFDLTWHLST
jgi:hypothetical protein